jgi:hypothetical protein
VPENFLFFLDTMLEEARADLNSAFDELGDDRAAAIRAARLLTLLQVKLEASDYEPA